LPSFGRLQENCGDFFLIEPTVCHVTRKLLRHERHAELIGRRKGRAA
jgi:hypothetical protein